MFVNEQNPSEALRGWGRGQPSRLRQAGQGSLSVSAGRLPRSHYAPHRQDTGQHPPVSSNQTAGGRADGLRYGGQARDELGWARRRVEAGAIHLASWSAVPAVVGGKARGKLGGASSIPTGPGIVRSTPGMHRLALGILARVALMVWISQPPPADTGPSQSFFW